MTVPPKPEKKCGGCGTEGNSDDLVLLEDNRYRPIVYLCRGRRNDPKGACLAKYLTTREPTCVVCDGELRSYSANNRVRPVCKDCEVKLAAMADREKGRKWYAIDVWDLFGMAIPISVHADYANLGATFLKALGDLGPRISGAEWIMPPPKTRRLDRYVNATIELTEAQAEAVREFAAKFAEVVEAVAKAKYAEGGNLLVKLAQGEVSVDEFDRQVATKGERR